MFLCIGVYGGFVVKGCDDGVIGFEVYMVFIFVYEDYVVIKGFGCDFVSVDY